MLRLRAAAIAVVLAAGMAAPAHAIQFGLKDGPGPSSTTTTSP
jgi:hypothetical protein